MRVASFPTQRKNVLRQYSSLRNVKMADSSQQRSRSKALALCVVIGIVGFAFFGIWRLSMFGQAPSKLTEELRSANADGLPLTADDIRKETAVSDQDNAAPLLLTAFSELKAFQKTPEGKELSKASSRNGGLIDATPDLLESLKPSIGHLSHFYEIISQAVKKPKLDFHRAWEAGPALLLPELAEEKGCLTPLVLKAKVAVGEGRTGEALEALDQGAKLSALAGQEPLVIGLLVQVAMRSQIYDAVGSIIRSHSNDMAVLDKAIGILHDLGGRPDVRPAIRSEFLMGRLAVKLLASSQGAQSFGSESGNAVTRLARFGPIRTVYDLRFTELYHQLYRDLSKNPNSVISMREAFMGVDQKLQETASKDWTFGLAELIAPVFSQMANALGESQAKQNVMLASIDILKAKLKSGAFPETWTAISDQWVDPFSEKRLIYVKKQDGFLVYSVGKDGKDNGGKPRPKKWTSEEYDIPFAFP